MKQLSRLSKNQKCCLLALGLCIPIHYSHAQVDESTVENIVKNAPCLDGHSIEEALKDKIRIRSQRDLGWQIFNEDGEFEVERAFLMNKSMQLRFRWHVYPDGSIKPVSSRAESLCIKE